MRLSSKVVVDEISIKQSMAKRTLSFLTLAVKRKLEEVEFPCNYHSEELSQTL